MEIRARYILMGAFLLAVMAGVVGFVYWLENTGGFQERTTYRIRFDGPVPGLYTGSSVLFNGIRVGEVSALRISSDKPHEIAADIAIAADTPIRTDTIVDLEYQGLTGVASIELIGGQGDAPLLVSKDGPPVLVANKDAGQSLTNSARLALLKLNAILDDNSQPFKELVSNLNQFASALSRNSDKVDGILSGLERMTGGKRGPDTDKVYDLTAPKTFTGSAKTLPGQLTVAVPTAIFQLDSQNILFRPTKDAAPLPPGARWADNLTRLVQAKVTQSFENAGYIGNVSSSDIVTGDYQLLIDIRSFQIITEPEPTADVEYSAKIVDSDGKILGAKLFHATAPANSTEAGPALSALNEAFQLTATDLVTWAPTVLPEPEEEPKLEPQAAPQPPEQPKVTRAEPSKSVEAPAASPAPAETPSTEPSETPTAPRAEALQPLTTPPAVQQ